MDGIMATKNVELRADIMAAALTIDVLKALVQGSELSRLASIGQELVALNDKSLKQANSPDAAASSADVTKVNTLISQLKEFGLLAQELLRIQPAAVVKETAELKTEITQAVTKGLNALSLFNHAKPQQATEAQPVVQHTVKAGR